MESAVADRANKEGTTGELLGTCTSGVSIQPGTSGIAQHSCAARVRTPIASSDNDAPKPGEKRSRRRLPRTRRDASRFNRLRAEKHQSAEPEDSSWEYGSDSSEDGLLQYLGLPPAREELRGTHPGRRTRRAVELTIRQINAASPQRTIQFYLDRVSPHPDVERLRLKYDTLGKPEREDDV